jgi:hypothetical protein
MVQYFGNPRNPRRRSYGPPFSPSSLGLDLWLEARDGLYSDAGTTPAVQDDPVYRMTDLSGNGHHADQATLGLRPILKTDGGFPVVRFTKTDAHRFVLATAVTLAQNAGCEVMLVAKSADGADAIVLFCAGSKQFRIGYAANQIQSFDLSTFGQSSTFGTAISGNYHAFGWSIPTSSGTLTFREGDTTRGTASFNLNSADTVIEEVATSAAEKPSMDLVAVFVKSGVFSAQERTDLLTYAATLHA